MKTLRESLQDYLVMRRALGYKLRTPGASLETFVSFMENAQVEYITLAQATAWAELPISVHPAQWERRLSYVRSFARYCSAMDTRTEIPPVGLFPCAYTRPTPYLFTDDDIRSLLQAALQLRATPSFVGHSTYCLLGLLSVTGLRISEALGLTMDDVDLNEGLLMIRSSKFGKSRVVPIHTSTVKVLSEYQLNRDRLLCGRQIPYFLLNSRGARMGYDHALDIFQHLCILVGLQGRMGSRRPHLHDLRHYFAIATLLRWYRDGQDIERRLPVLSAFLGHVEVRNTYWYLSACPELLGAARDRLVQRWEQTS
jgi:integrase/recombinase XerD